MCIYNLLALAVALVVVDAGADTATSYWNYRCFVYKSGSSVDCHAPPSGPNHISKAFFAQSPR